MSGKATGGIVTFVSSVIVLVPIAICSVGIPWYIATKEPKYYDYAPRAVNNGEDFKFNVTENEKIPSILKSALCERARTFVESFLGKKVATVFLDSSRPLESKSRWEVFTVVVVLEDGNKWLERAAIHVDFKVDVNAQSIRQQADSIYKLEHRDASVRY